MTRRFISLPLLFLTALVAYSQNPRWTKQDSIKLQRILNGADELKLNPEAVQQIDFGSLGGAPMQSAEKTWMLPDETLPYTLPGEAERQKVVLTLFPNLTNTKFNVDVVSGRKIKLNANTWRNDPFYNLKNQYIYSNWAKKPMDGGERKSYDEIEATGLRYNLLGERANNMAVGSWKQTSGPSNLDFMTPFTKDFWDFKGRKNRMRTLDVLSTYGDSTTVLIPDALPKLIIR